GVQEGRLIGDAAVDVGLRREVDDRVEAFLAQERLHGVALGDVEALEAETRVGREIREVGEVAGIGEEIDGDQAPYGPGRRAAGLQGLADAVRADEAGGTGSEQPHRAMLAHRHSRSPAPGALSSEVAPSERRRTAQPKRLERGEADVGTT